MSEETIGKQLAEKIWELAMKKEHPKLMKDYEPKPTYIGEGTDGRFSCVAMPNINGEPIAYTLDDFQLQAIWRKQREQEQRSTLSINGEPLSTKALHDVIVSQSYTLDATLTRNGELMDALKRVRKLLKVGHYDQAMKILDMVLG